MFLALGILGIYVLSSNTADISSLLRVINNSFPPKRNDFSRDNQAKKTLKVLQSIPKVKY